MSRLAGRSVLAVVAGALTAIVVTTLIDIVLHATHVYPPLDQPIDSALAALASSSLVFLAIPQAWVGAKLAMPRRAASGS